MSEEQLVKLASVIGATIHGLYDLFMWLPLWGQIITGVVTAIFALSIGFKIWVFWLRIKALRYGRIYW
ncbi:MAG: hypothetical protein V3V31_16210 [Methylococcales bacterium]